MAEGGNNDDLKKFILEELLSTFFRDQMEEISNFQIEAMKHYLNMCNTCLTAIKSLVEALDR